MSKWIKCSDRLPNVNEWVLAFGNYGNGDTNGIALTCYFFDEDKQKYYWKLLSSGCGCCDTDMKNVSHWMPEPKAPNE